MLLLLNAKGLHGEIIFLTWRPIPHTKCLSKDPFVKENKWGNLKASRKDMSEKSNANSNPVRAKEKERLENKRTLSLYNELHITIWRDCSGGF